MKKRKREVVESFLCACKTERKEKRRREEEKEGGRGGGHGSHIIHQSQTLPSPPGWTVHVHSVMYRWHYSYTITWDSFSNPIVLCHHTLKSFAVQTLQGTQALAAAVLSYVFML